MNYDGSGKLSEALAVLYELSNKSLGVSELLKEAKNALGITSKAKNLPADVKLAIYQWHYEKFNPVQNVKQVGNIITVQNIKQDDEAEESVYDFKQIHFAIVIEHQGKPKRTTIMLEGYLVKALQRKHELTDNTAIRQWLEQIIKGDPIRFDSYAPLTRQVKRLIIESLV